jgi:thioredoxin-dependent peroxiredoxin
LCDPERRVGPAYGAARPADDPHPQYARRVTYLLDPRGVVRRSYQVTDIEAHLDQVLADAEELIAATARDTPL